MIAYMKPDMTIVVEAETGAESVALEAWYQSQDGEKKAGLELRTAATTAAKEDGNG